jgi:hypothetical protein
MFATITVIWMYVVGVWMLYESITYAADEDGVELQMDILGGLMLLFWFISFPAMTIFSFFFGSDEDE